jgi:hypothetical protein
MAGGLLSLIAIGDQNIILTGNPTKSFFKSTYSKYTNFGLQKFRIDQIGQKELDVSKPTTFSFKIERYGDLLMDTYLVVKLPTIWSPILYYNKYPDIDPIYRPYEFKWIKNIGSQIITEVKIMIDGITIQKFSGHYLQNIVERDFDSHKKALFDIMTGNISELTDPANFNNRNNNYPNAFNINEINPDISGIEPSIREYNLYIPINSWFSMSSFMAFPLICLQYSNLVIDFTLRPIYELFTIKDVLYDMSINTHKIANYNNIPQIQPLQTTLEYQFNRFINPPPTKNLSYNVNSYINLPNRINSNIHILCTQCFLDNTEREMFAKNSQNYLIKEVNEYSFIKVIKANKIKLESNGLISSWMWYFQRSDVKDRNEWSNYTNWPYETIIPNDLQKVKDASNYKYYTPHFSYNSGDISKNIYYTGYNPTIYEQTNVCEIMKNFAIICDGKYREQTFDSSVFSKLEKYNTSNGPSSKVGLYYYNFALITDPFKLQPTGAFNTNKFKTIEFEYNNYANPPIDTSNVEFTTICDPETQAVIATSKDPTNIYKYYYNLNVIEEKYNILFFQNGFGSLLYSR